MGVVFIKTEGRFIMRVGITGSSGFIGWHLRCLLHERRDIEVIEANEEEFSSLDKLRGFVRSCDGVFHLAGMNRGPSEDVYKTNVEIAELLVEACKSTDSRPHVVFANSVQMERDNPYGRGKRKAAETLRKFSEETGASLTNVILPNVFGEHGKPFYNSVVATFCHQLAKGEKPEIIEDNQMDLLHVRDAVELMLDSMENGVNGDMQPGGRAIKVSSLLKVLHNMDTCYRSGVVPDLSDMFNLQLFNTYRSFLFPSFYPTYPELSSDNRGWLFELIRTESGGQAFASSTEPGVTRGNHYHVRKFERFLVIKGEATISLRRLLTDEVTSFNVSGEQPAFVDIPTLHTHNITNIGQDGLLTLFWAGEFFDSERPDTYPEVV